MSGTATVAVQRGCVSVASLPHRLTSATLHSIGSLHLFGYTNFGVDADAAGTIMRRLFLGAKIHRATVTHADLSYEGSITIDSDLLAASGIAEFEAVAVWNVNNGSRLTTYVMAGSAGSGTICLNGAAARLNQPGDIVIIATMVELEAHEIKDHRPIVVFVDDRNRCKQVRRAEMPGPFLHRDEPLGPTSKLSD
jgi:aspartate 1-decarboxylase